MERAVALSIITIVLVAACSGYADQVIYVDVNAPGVNDGSSWENAYVHLRDALAKAGSLTKPVEVYVAQGLYRPDRDTSRPYGSRSIRTSFELVSGVCLFGGFPAGGGTWEDRDPNIHTTILSGDLSGNDNPNTETFNLLDDPSRVDNSCNVVVISKSDQQTILDGFTITGGNAKAYRNAGGGVYTRFPGASVTIANCTITANTAEYYGGGLWGFDGSISHCTISSNHGGGLSYCEGSISYSIISGNSVRKNGGGLYACTGPISNCTISGNSTQDNGGGLSGCHGSITSCIVSGNTADDRGGGLSRCYGPITHSTIVGNVAEYAGGLFQCEGLMSNSIVWANRQDSDSPLELCPSPIFTCVEAGNSGVGCIDVDPQFLASGYWDPNGNQHDASDDFWVEGDYHLLAGSPCIDAGSFASVNQMPGTDADGNTRLAGPQTDMGCFEFGGSPDADGDWLADIAEPAYADNPDRDEDNILDGIELLRGADPNTYDPIGRLYVPDDVSIIQRAIFLSRPGETVVLSEGVYYENLCFAGRNITLASTDPNDPSVVAATVINGRTGSGPIAAGGVISLAGTEDETCRITGLTITGGIAEGYGGGIHGRGSHATISYCTITGNAAPYGAGLSHCNGAVTNCTISGNTASGVVYYCGRSIRSCTIAGVGGGLYYCGGSIKNCTIVGNAAALDGGGLGQCYGLISNCIIWANRQSGDSQLYNSQDLYFTCIQGGATGAGSNDSDPLFVTPGYWDPNSTPDDANDDFWVDGDYHLKSQGWRWDSGRNRWTYDAETSPCIDAGDPAAPLGDEPLTIAEDLDNTYGSNMRINMGAYGGTAQASIAPHDWAIRSDYSNDGTVNFSDFACWTYGLKSGTVISGDLDRNGIADFDDLSILAEDWLKQTSWFAGPLSMDPLPDPPSGGTHR